MPMVPSTYWNNVHGNTAEQTAADLEGLQTMRNLAKTWHGCSNVSRRAKAGIEAPAAERGNQTNFIR